MKQLVKSLREDADSFGVEGAIQAFGPTVGRSTRPIRILPFAIAGIGVLGVLAAPLAMSSTARAVSTQEVERAMAKQPRVVQTFEDAKGHVYMKTWRDGSLRRLDMYSPDFTRSFNGDLEIVIDYKHRTATYTHRKSASFGIADGIPFKILTIGKGQNNRPVEFSAYMTSETVVGTGPNKHMRGRTDYSVDPKSLLPLSSATYVYRREKFELRNRAKFSYPKVIPETTFNPVVPDGFTLIRS